MATLRRLGELHFEKEESLFYPMLRRAYPDLLAQMDLQHEDIREVEQHVAEMLADAPELPEVRWLDEIRRSGTDYTIAFSTTLSMKKPNSCRWPAAI